jgi:LPXTG-motif cell wall-anchored protein
MDTTTLVRIIAGVLAVAVAAFLVYRRKNAKAH